MAVTVKAVSKGKITVTFPSGKEFSAYVKRDGIVPKVGGSYNMSFETPKGKGYSVITKCEEASEETATDGTKTSSKAGTKKPNIPEERAYWDKREATKSSNIALMNYRTILGKLLISIAPKLNDKKFDVERYIEHFNELLKYGKVDMFDNENLEPLPNATATKVTNVRDDVKKSESLATENIPDGPDEDYKW